MYYIKNLKIIYLKKAKQMNCKNKQTNLYEYNFF